MEPRAISLPGRAPSLSGRGSTFSPNRLRASGRGVFLHAPIARANGARRLALARLEAHNQRQNRRPGRGIMTRFMLAGGNHSLGLALKLALKLASIFLAV